jgi:cobalt-zinc-cadmium efflux system outer membrane protein
MDPAPGCAAISTRMMPIPAPRLRRVFASVAISTAAFSCAGAQETPVLTLDSALTRARALRPRLGAAAAGVARAQGAARVGAIVANPVVQGELDDISPTSRLTATQSLAWLPRRGADLAAGRAAVQRARADSSQAVADVGRDVHRAFYAALAAERQLALALEQGALADSVAGLAVRRAAVGDISGIESEQVALEAARARLAAGQARELARVAQAELARAIAWNDAVAPRPVGALDAGLDAADVTGRADLTSALEGLPALRGAVADSAAAAARLRAARIARIPVPGLVAGREWNGEAGQRNLILGLALPLPLWSWNGEAVAQARGAAREQAALAAETRLTLRAALAAAHARVEEAALRARFARDSLLPNAQRVRSGAVRLYEEGRTSVVPMLDALRAERDVSRAAVAELLAWQQARADLAATLGQWR